MGEPDKNQMVNSLKASVGRLVYIINAALRIWDWSTMTKAFIFKPETDCA